MLNFHRNSSYSPAQQISIGSNIQAEAASLRPESFDDQGAECPSRKIIGKINWGAVCYLQRNPDAPLARNERKLDFTGQRPSGCGFVV
jgi:hypothetical protein